MGGPRLHSKARVVLVLNALYGVAEGLCSAFVGVYFYIISLDYRVVCYHYFSLYVVTPVVFILAGWYSQARDRVHVFRLGLALHAVYYATLLWLRQDAPQYAVPLGALLGVTWGFFWAGNNTFNFDVTTVKERDYFFGWLSTISGAARLAAPLISALIIRFAGENQAGYHLVFGVAVLLYLAAIVVSGLVPPDRGGRPFRIRRALLPGKDQRDWQYLMLASASLAGSFHILYFLLGIVIFMQTGSEVSVGGLAAVQALAGIVTSYLIGRVLIPRTRRTAMFWAVVIHLIGGAAISLRLNLFTVVLFGLLNSISSPLFGIPHSSVRFDVIDRCAEEPAQRIEYLCAWEVPLAIGRVIMMTVLIALSSWLSETGLRITLFLLCANRILTYCLVTRVSSMRRER